MFTRSDLFALIDADPALAVSMFMPTHVLGRETRQDPVRLNNLVSQALKKLQNTGQKHAETKALLEPAAQLADDYGFWQHQDHGLAEQVRGDADYENPLMAQPIGRPMVGTLDVSKSQVQGASPEDWRKGRLLEYIRRIGLALRDQVAAVEMAEGLSAAALLRY